RLSVRGHLDRGANPLISPAAADVAVHHFIDVAIGRLGIRLQECSGLHDLTGLTVPALDGIDLAPGLLHWMIALGAESLDGGDGLRGDVLHAHLAAADRVTVQVDGAGSALTDAAAVFGSGEFEQIAEIPQQRHLGIAIELLVGAVYFESDHRRSPKYETIV